MKKHALITGGNSGIGYATAKLLQKKGVSVVITGRDREKLQQVANECGFEFLVADLSHPQQVVQLAADYGQRPLDYLINNAGIANFCPIEAHELGFIQATLNTNVIAPMLLIQHLLPALIESQGAVCNVSSAIVHNAGFNLSAYAASKGALEAFTRNLALELAGKKVRVNCVSPGAITTPIIDKLGFPEELKNDLVANFSQTIPLKRYGTPEEVAQVIVSQLESTYVTGSVWNVDGGVDVT